MNRAKVNARRNPTPAGWDYRIGRLRYRTGLNPRQDVTSTAREPAMTPSVRILTLVYAGPPADRLAPDHPWQQFNALGRCLGRRR
jgi:hypothetical protein